MRVVYSVDFGIDVDATSKNLAIHQAGEQWPELRQAVEALGSGVVIRRIAVEGGKKADDQEGAE